MKLTKSQEEVLKAAKRLPHKYRAAIASIISVSHRNQSVTLNSALEVIAYSLHIVEDMEAGLDNVEDEHLCNCDSCAVNGDGKCAVCGKGLEV